MSDASVELQGLIDRVRRGDHDARRQLLDHACGRLRRLAAHIFAGSFPGLRASHDLDSVVNETWLRLAQALDRVDVPTVADFFRLAAHKVRQVLLDMADRHRRLAGHEVRGLDGSSAGPSVDPGQITSDPARLALWTELHEQVEKLPPDERAVFEMHYYLGLPQAQVAGLLGLPPRKVSRLWVAATERLSGWLPGADEAGRR
jgi:RNA polymerase sigma factor (sigma-70 family)